MKATYLLTHVVKHGRRFPLPGDTFLSEGTTGRVFRITVRRLVDVRWQRDGSLLIEVIGTREAVKAA